MHQKPNIAIKHKDTEGTEKMPILFGYPVISLGLCVSVVDAKTPGFGACYLLDESL